MPARRQPSTPRATRAMIDLLYAVGSCDDIAGSWDVSGQAEGLVARARSRDTFDSESAATEVAEQILKRLLPGGHDAVSTSVAARAEGGGDRWRGVAEVVVLAG